MKSERVGGWIVKTITIILFSLGSNFVFAQTINASSEDKAYLHLNQVMDKFSNSFDLYTDANAGGNHYISSGWMGDRGDISFDTNYTINPHSGLTCICIDYSAQESQGKGWAGIYWQDPENNWGNQNGGYDLSGATELTFWARGENGGEWVDFKIGGINRQPHYNPDFPYQDAFGPISTGFVQLTHTWQRYTIPLDKDYFDIYRDQHVSYYPSGWMGDWGDISFDDQCTENPYNGRTCIKITYSAQASQGKSWAGIYWQHPQDNWGNKEGGYNLSGFERITFWAKGKKSGEKLEFKVGGITGPYGDSLQPAKTTGIIILTNTWQKYSIDLTGENLSHIIGSFCWVTNISSNPSGCTFYLDDIRYERALSPDELRRVIGGFAFVTNKDSNPGGCNFYLDDIQFDKARPESLRLLQSYEILDPLGESALANTAYTYDNALAMLAYMARGKADDWRRAKIIGDTFVYCQNHDRRYTDGRLRNAYRSGNIAENVTGNALLPGWWNNEENKWLEDKEMISTSTGNLVWVIIAWLRYCELTGDETYLEAALNLGQWIFEHTYDTRGDGGYTGGYLGWANDPPEKLYWKSTEHNIDIYVAFMKLFELTGDSIWKNRALHAKGFVEAMWDSIGGHFWTGTLVDGVTENKDVLPADVNTWGLMALQGYKEAVAWVEDNCKVDPCPRGCGFKGFDFNDDRDGVWFEGTAHMVIAFQILSENLKAGEFLAELRRAQNEANNANGRGIVAACHDGVTTGFDWVYNNRLHIGATTWYIFAEKGYNPYWGTGMLPGDANGDGSINVQDVIGIINVILDTGTASGSPDCNDDGNVNVQDVICVINKILGG